MGMGMGMNSAINMNMIFTATIITITRTKTDMRMLRTTIINANTVTTIGISGRDGYFYMQYIGYQGRRSLVGQQAVVFGACRTKGQSRIISYLVSIMFDGDI